MRLLALFPLLTTACPPVIGDGGGVDCDTMAYASVQATVVASSGEAVPDAFVTVDGEPCESFGEEAVWVCGWERSGELTIVADAQGYAAKELVVDVPQGECHVETQQVTLTLEEVACPPVVLYGVEVTPVSPDGEPVEDATVEWLPLDGMEYTSPMRCEGQGETWACAENTGGEIEIWASSREYGSFYEVVDVPMDDCGPIPQRVTATLTR